MGLQKDSWPHVNFYDVSIKRAVRLNANRNTIKFKVGSTKGRGPGHYYQVMGVTDEGRKLYKFMSKANFDDLKGASVYRGRRSRSGRRMRRRSRSRSGSSSRSRSRSGRKMRRRRRSKSRSRRRSSRSSRSGKRMRRSKCNRTRRKSCKRSSKCNWVPRKSTRSGRKVKAGYCRRK